MEHIHMVAIRKYILTIFIQSQPDDIVASKKQVALLHQFISRQLCFTNSPYHLYLIWTVRIQTFSKRVFFMCSNSGIINFVKSVFLCLQIFFFFWNSNGLYPLFLILNINNIFSMWSGLGNLLCRRVRRSLSSIFWLFDGIFVLPVLLPLEFFQSFHHNHMV